MEDVLIVTDVDFWAKGAGHRMRILSMVEYLSIRVNLSIAYVGILSRATAKSVADNFKIRFFVLEHSKTLGSLGYGRRLQALQEQHSFGTIIIEYIHNSYFLNHIAENTTVILDTHDIISNRTEQFKNFNNEGILFEMSRLTEFSIFSVYDYVLALCEPDYQEIAASIGPGKVILCPHYVSQTKPQLREKATTIGFIASQYLPNIDGIKFFLNYCWPKISRKNNVNLNIYGNVCGAVDFSFFENVTAKGYISSIAQIYNETDIVINPVRFGAGLKIKTIEALSYGMPLVATSHAVRGLESQKDKAFLVADEPEDFAAAIQSLIDDFDLRKSISANAYRFIESDFSSKKCFEPLLRVIRANSN